MGLKIHTGITSHPIIHTLATSMLLFVASVVLSGCAWQSQQAQTFRAYLQQQAAVHTSREQHKAITRFLDNQPLSQSEQKQIHKFLGRYAVEKYGDDALATLADWVAIPTYRQPGIAQHENPEFKKLAAAIETKASAFGLEFRNIDDRVYEITLPGSGKELVGLHAHADVVPVTPANWVLDNGTRLDPFTVTQIDNRLYGRGTEDDKNGIVVTLYGMRVIAEENLPLNRTFKLLIDTTEETTGDAIPYYFARNPTPEYNLAMDGSYPVVIAEKGYGVVTTRFPVTSATGQGMEFTEVTGALASNQIPKTASALIATETPAATRASLRLIADRFIAQHGSNFSIDLAPEANRIRMTINGVSAHSSDPASGVNPVSRLWVLIDQIAADGQAKQNHITEAARYVSHLWGLNYYGEQLGIQFNHPFMGPLTNAVTLIESDDQQLTLAVNLRVPKGRPTQSLKQEIEQKLLAWSQANKIDFELSIRLAEPMYRNPKGAWVNALLDVASENLSLPREFVASAGATSVHNLPNGVQFGLSMPGVKYTGHNANEFKTVDQFLLDLRVVTEMMITVGQLSELN